jgi:hypothetical protein
MTFGGGLGRQTQGSERGQVGQMQGPEGGDPGPEVRIRTDPERDAGPGSVRKASGIVYRPGIFTTWIWNEMPGAENPRSSSVE